MQHNPLSHVSALVLLLMAPAAMAASGSANAPASAPAAGKSGAHASPSQTTPAHAAPNPPKTNSGASPSSAASSRQVSPSSGHSAMPPPPGPPHALPDYGGRDSIAATVSAVPEASALNPLAQAWRAFEALAIVLALVVGGLYALKRSGLIDTEADGETAKPAAAAGFHLLNTLVRRPKHAVSPASPPAAGSDCMTLIDSQTLPNSHGAALHLVTVGGKTLLLGATSQGISLLTTLEPDWDAAAHNIQFAPPPRAGFEDLLAQADSSPVRVSSETELLLNATTMRLQAMIARSETQTNGFHS